MPQFAGVKSDADELEITSTSELDFKVVRRTEDEPECRSRCSSP